MIKIKQYVSSEFCLECRECCKFEFDIWLPHLLKADEKQLGISCVKAKKSDDSPLVCQFLNESSHICSVYEKRPFECLLYPFLIVKNNNSLDLTAHLGCPYIIKHVNSIEFREYANYLVKILLQPQILKLFKHDSDKFHCYPDIELYVVKKGLISNA